MGELFGFDSATRTSWSLQRRTERPGHYREEGWGVAVFEGPAAGVFRQPRGIPDEFMAGVLASGRLQGEGGLAYIRRWTNSPALANCHPFTREMGGREWAFAHNGRLDGIKEGTVLRPTTYQPIGSTDSEYAFCIMLSVMSAHREDPPASHREAVRQISTEMAKHGALNYVLLTERCLYAFTSGEYGLHLWERTAAEAPVTLRDEDWEMRLEPAEPSDLVVVATNRMAKEPGWRALRPGELLLAVNGRVVE